jgi:hypothetical protein
MIQHGDPPRSSYYFEKDNVKQLSEYGANVTNRPTRYNDFPPGRDCESAGISSDSQNYNQLVNHQKHRATSRTNNSSEEACGMWMGFFICIILFFFLIFILSYPANYYYRGHYYDRNRNGIPDSREWPNSYYSFYHGAY